MLLGGIFAEALATLGDCVSQKRKPPSESSPSVSAQGRDTSQGINTFTPDGQNAVFKKTIDAPRVDVNYAVEKPDAFTPSTGSRVMDEDGGPVRVRIADIPTYKSRVQHDPYTRGY